MRTFRHSIPLYEEISPRACIYDGKQFVLNQLLSEIAQEENITLNVNIKSFFVAKTGQRTELVTTLTYYSVPVPKEMPLSTLRELARDKNEPLDTNDLEEIVDYLREKLKRGRLDDQISNAVSKLFIDAVQLKEMIENG